MAFTEIPTWKSATGTQSELQKAFAEMKDPTPITESFTLPNGEKVERLLSNEAFNFWTTMMLPPLPDKFIPDSITDHPAVSKPELASSSELNNTVNDTGSVSDGVSNV